MTEQEERKKVVSLIFIILTVVCPGSHSVCRCNEETHVRTERRVCVHRSNVVEAVCRCNEETHVQTERRVCVPRPGLVVVGLLRLHVH